MYDVVRTTQGLRPDVKYITIGSDVGIPATDKPSRSEISLLVNYDKMELLTVIKRAKYDLIVNPTSKVFTRGMAKLAAEKKVGVCLELRKLYYLRGCDLSFALRELRDVAKLCVKYKVPIVLCTGAVKPEELRSPHSLIVFGQLLGLNTKQAKMAITYYPEQYVRRVLHVKKREK